MRHFALVHLSLEEQHRIHRLIAAYYSNSRPRVEELVAAFDHLETAREVQDLLEAM